MHMLWFEGCFRGDKEEDSIWLWPLWRERAGGTSSAFGLHSWVPGGKGFALCGGCVWSALSSLSPPFLLRRYRWLPLWGGKQTGLLGFPWKWHSAHRGWLSPVGWQAICKVPPTGHSLLTKAVCIVSVAFFSPPWAFEIIRSFFFLFSFFFFFLASCEARGLTWNTASTTRDP